MFLCNAFPDCTLKSECSVREVQMTAPHLFDVSQQEERPLEAPPDVGWQGCEELIPLLIHS